MQGVVTEINITRGMVAVKTEDGDYSIFEMLFDTNFNIGDEVYWTEDCPTEHCDVTNITTDEIAEVYFQNHNVSASNVSSKMLY